MRYNLKNEALVGACFLPSGLGGMSRLSYPLVVFLTNSLGLVGAPLSGYLSDRIVVYYRKKRGVWYPEDRLRAALVGALILVPLSVFISGLLTEYVPGTLGLTLNLVCLFVNGFGVILITSFVLSFVLILGLLDRYCTRSLYCLSH